MEPLRTECVVVPWEDLVDLFTVHQPNQALTAADVVTDTAVGQPVNHGSVIHNIATEKQLIVPVMKANASPRVSGHVKHSQLSVTKIDDITFLQYVCGLHSLHFVVPCPPSRAGSLGYLPVAEPSDRLEVVSVGQGIDLRAVDAHLLELMQTTGVVEVGVGGDGKQRVLPLRVFSQQAFGVDVFR